MWIKSAAQIWCNCHKCWMTNESRNSCKHNHARLTETRRSCLVSGNRLDKQHTLNNAMRWEAIVLKLQWSKSRSQWKALWKWSVRHHYPEERCSKTSLQDRPQSQSLTSTPQTWSHSPSSNHTDGERRQNTCISCLHGRDSCSSP